MRIVLRIVSFEMLAAWALVLAGSLRAAAQAWPDVAEKLTAGWHDRWRARTGLSVGIPVLTCWPVLFWLGPAHGGAGLWLRAVAIPWWILLAVFGLRLLLARAWNV